MNLMDYLPPRYRDSPETADWQKALQFPLEKLWAAREDYFKQLDLDTATWGLALWERAYGIEAEAGKPDDYRRARVMSKMRGQGTATAAMLRNMAASFADTEAVLIEHPETHHFDIKFTGRLGTPPNMADLTAAVNEVKPAHLTFGYLYTYLMLRQVHEAMTLAELERQPMDLFAF